MGYKNEFHKAIIILRSSQKRSELYSFRGFIFYLRTYEVYIWEEDGRQFRAMLGWYPIA